MRERPLWLLFMVLCLLGPALASYHWWHYAPHAMARAVSLEEARDGVRQEAQNALIEYQRQHGALPCPVPLNRAEESSSEAEKPAEHFCDEPEALETGRAKGMLPWRVLGMVKDPKIFYAVSQSAVDPVRCHLAARLPLLTFDADVLNKDDGETPSFPACANPIFATSGPALAWNPQSAHWEPEMVATQEDAQAALPAMPEQADGAQSLLSPDGIWLAALDRAALPEGDHWLRWWRRTEEGTQWIPIGRWRLKQNTGIERMAVAGNRLLLVTRAEGISELSDIPLWPKARPVVHISLGAEPLQGWMVLPDGRGMGIKKEKHAWAWLAVDEAWKEAITPGLWPALGESDIDARMDASGENAISWNAKGGTRLWLWREGAWKSLPGPMAKGALNWGWRKNAQGQDMLTVLMAGKNGWQWQSWRLQGEVLHPLAMPLHVPRSE